MLYKKTEKLSIIKREGEIMLMFVNPNAASFQCAVNSEIYIDKTGLLEYTNKVLGTNARFICNSRPRRFGKSVTVDMLTAYYSRGCNSAELFDKLAIASEEGYESNLNKYNVIHLNMIDFLSRTDSIDDLIKYLKKKVLRELKKNIRI